MEFGRASSIAPVTAAPPDDPTPGDHDAQADPDKSGSMDGEHGTTTVDTDEKTQVTAPVLARSASLTSTDRVIPTWTDPTVRRASDAIGGPMGRHALVGRTKLLTPLRVCLLMAILILICGWLFKAACIQQGPNGSGGVVLDQGGQRPWIAACYNDAVPLFGSHKLDQAALPYATSWEDNGQTRYMEYPVVTGYWMWLMAELSRGYMTFTRTTGIVPVPLDVAAYFTIGAIFLGLMYLWAVASTAKIARRRIWDTAIMCLSPLLIVHAFTNWDLLAIGITAGAMLAWARKKPVLAGALLGLGTAAKLYPILLLGPLLVLFLITCVAIGWLGLSAARRPRFAQLAFLVIAAFLLTNKVWSPQYSLWLLPLAVLALPRWRPLLLWQASEAVVWVLLMLSFAGEANKGLSVYPFINAALVRDAMVLILVFLVVRDILRPAGDLVRMAGDDDPSGGVLEDAPDRFTLPSLPRLWGARRAAAPEDDPLGVAADPAPTARLDTEIAAPQTGADRTSG